MISLPQLFKRDRQVCHICQQRVGKLSDATRDHKIPKIYGGTNDNDNIALAHKWCNRDKGARIFRAEQHGTGWVIVDPNNEIVSDEYPTYADAQLVAQDMNADYLYMDDRYNSKSTQHGMEQAEEIVIIRRVQNHPM
jgi:hypothetical protein